MDATEITLIVGAIGTLLGVLTASIVAIIQAAKGTTIAAQTRDLVAATSAATTARGVVRDGDAREVLDRVNGRLTAALRLLVVATRKAAEHGDADDIDAHRAAVEALALALDVEPDETRIEAEAAAVAAEGVAAGLVASVPSPPVRP